MPSGEIRHHAAGIEVGLKRAELQLPAAKGRVGGAAVALLGLSRNAAGQRL
jgi:hypothetical protein